LRQQEFARLSDAVTPRLEQFHSITHDGFREEIAAMLERLGHAVTATAPELVTIRQRRKYLTVCAIPTDQMPTKTPTLRRFHDAVVASGAARAFI
jgi:hypothetical protein